MVRYIASEMNERILQMLSLINLISRFVYFIPFRGFRGYEQENTMCKEYNNFIIWTLEQEVNSCMKNV